MQSGCLYLNVENYRAEPMQIDLFSDRSVIFFFPQHESNFGIMDCMCELVWPMGKY